MSASPLVISNLVVSTGAKEILHGVTLTVKPHSVHAIMGPNGSGKSTLASAFMGHPAYNVKGNISIGGVRLAKATSEVRAKHGLFLAFQSPIAIPGVSVMNLLRASYQAIAHTKASKGKTLHNPILSSRATVGDMSIADFADKVTRTAKKLSLDPLLLTRGIHDGFSGGERKKIEMLQALVLAPKFAIFDEIDTGLDVDALKTVARAITLLKSEGTGVIIITHYQRILRYVTPDVVHVLVKGHFVDEGDAKLAHHIEASGYNRYLTKEA